MRLKIWWIPALPGTPFEWEVSSQEEGFRLLNALVDYTRYLEDRGLLPEYAADAGGLQAMEDGEWYDSEMVLGDEAEWEYQKGSR